MSGQPHRKRVAIVFDTTCKPANDRLAGALDFIAGKTDWSPILLQVDLFSSAQLIRFWSRIKPEAAIFQCSGRVKPFLSHFPIPTVSFESSLSEYNFKADIRVKVDDKAIAATAADYFLKRGFKCAAYVCAIEKGEKNRSRIRAQSFKAAFARHGNIVRVLDITNGHARFGERIDRFLTGLPKPCAVFAYSDREAREVVNHCNALGVSVPKQISVLGVDNDECLCESGSTAISSILPDFKASGYDSAEQLARLIECGRPKKAIILTGVKCIVERESTRNIGAAHRLVDIVRKYIETHYQESFTFAELLDAVNTSSVSLRMIEKAFRETKGRSIREELKLHRLNAAASLLCKSNLRIAEIARHTGLRTSTNLYTLFFRQFNMSPSAWRKAHSDQN